MSSATFVPRRLARIALALTAVAGAALARPALAQSMWTLRTDSEIVFQRLTPLGSLLVSTENDLSAIDPATGQLLWKRTDIRKLKECNYDEMENTPYGLIDYGEGMAGMQRGSEVLDLETGRPKWDSHNLPFKSSQGQFQAPQKNLLLLVGTPENGKKPMLAAADLETGTLKWQQEALFKKPLQVFEVRGSGRLIKRYSVEGNQAPVYDTDDTAILWLSGDGPVKIDLATGNRLWVADRLAGHTPPALRSGYAPILASEGQVFVPYGRSLQALDATSGTFTWRRARGFKSPVVQMRLVREGLVVRGAPIRNEKGKLEGRPFVDLLDPATGASRWKKPFKGLDHASTFEVSDGTLHIAADGELLAIDLASGAARRIARIRFKGGEMPATLERVDGNTVLASSQNLMMIDAEGTVRYHAFHDALGSSGPVKPPAIVPTPAPDPGPIPMASLEGTAAAEAAPNPLLIRHPALAKRFEARRSAAGHSVMLTQLEVDGRKGPGLVKLDKATGGDLAKVVLGDRTPDFEIDPVEGRVFFLRSGREVVCYKF